MNEERVIVITGGSTGLGSELAKYFVTKGTFIIRTKGTFNINVYEGGLPGDGWTTKKPIQSKSMLKDGQVVFKAEEGTAVLKGKTLTISNPAGTLLGKLTRVVRSSSQRLSCF